MSATVGNELSVLQTRTRNILERGGYRSKEQLIAATDDQLREVRLFGEAALQDVRKHFPHDPNMLLVDFRKETRASAVAFAVELGTLLDEFYGQLSNIECYRSSDQKCHGLDGDTIRSIMVEFARTAIPYYFRTYPDLSPTRTDEE